MIMTHQQPYTPRHRARRPLIPRRVRRYLYQVATATVPLLVAYGIIDQQTAPLWIALAASVTATATAALHTPKAGDSE